MNVVFFGSSSFSVPILESIASFVSCVVTKKGKPKGRGYLLEDSEVKRAATALRLPVVEIESFKDQAAGEIEAYKPSLFVVASFGLIIPRWALEIPSIGPVNVHPSLLPKYRGPSPIQWALWNGDKETGITFIRMNEKMDAGNILSKNLEYLASAQMAGIVLGATAPVVLTSRSDPPRARVYSLALAGLLARGGAFSNEE